MGATEWDECFYKSPRRDPYAFHQMRTEWEVKNLQRGRGPSPVPDYAGILTLNFQLLELWETNVCYLQATHSVGIEFVIEAQMD